MTAAELMAELTADDRYLARRAADDAQREVRVRGLRQAEQPIVADLRSAGVLVDSVWDLVNTAEPYPAALPVLLWHLRHGDYPDRVRESLGSALAVRPAAPYWPLLQELYQNAEGRGAEEGLAVALAASATAEHLEPMLELLDDDTRSDSRVHLLRAVKRVGGRRGREVLLGLGSDPLFGPEARHLTIDGE